MIEYIISKTPKGWVYGEAGSGRVSEPHEYRNSCVLAVLDANISQDIRITCYAERNPVRKTYSIPTAYIISNKAA